MDGDELASMYAEIVLREKKSDSLYIKTAEDSASWDKIAAQVAEQRRKQPLTQFAIPN